MLESKIGDFSNFSIKNICCQYSENLKFHTKVNEDKIKYSTTYEVNANSILDARAQNWLYQHF